MEKPVVTILCRTGGESQKRKFPLDYPPGIWYYIRCIQYAPVAQLDRASDSDSEGRAFEPHRAYQSRHGFHGGIFFASNNIKVLSPVGLQNGAPAFWNAFLIPYRLRHTVTLHHCGLFPQTACVDRLWAGIPLRSDVVGITCDEVNSLAQLLLNPCRKAHRNDSLFTIHYSLAPKRPLPFIMIDLIKEGASPW